MKKLFAIIALVLLLCLSACGKSEPEPLPPVPTVNPTEFTDLNARLAAAESEHESYVYLINARANGEKQLLLEGETELVITAELPEDMRLKAWTVNGQVLNTTEPTITLSLGENTVVKAELRPVKKVTAVNCTMQFLNYYENSGGESFTELVFEEDYLNSFTGLTEKGGQLSVCVQAPIPAGKSLEYWLVNGERLDVHGTVNIFNAFVTDSTTFEPVFTDKNG